MPSGPTLNAPGGRFCWSPVTAMLYLRMKQSLLDQYRNVWRSIGLSDGLVAARNLPLFEEAAELLIAEVTSSGRVFHLTPSATEAWNAMKAAAQNDGVDIFLVSAYRSVARQAELIQQKLAAGRSLDDVLAVLAPPGCSEHHTGRAVDIGTGNLLPLEPDFEQAPAFAWLAARAHEFGFTLSFPQGNRFSYIYEPWHWCFSEMA